MGAAEQADTARAERGVTEGGGGSSHGSSNVERSPEQMQVHTHSSVYDKGWFII